MNILSLSSLSSSWFKLTKLGNDELVKIFMIWYIISEAFFDKTYIDDTFGPKLLVIRTGSNPLKAKSDIFAKKKILWFY